jgi:hypothetical protein
MTAKRRHYRSWAVQRRATQRAQDKADDEFYAEQARKKREAEEAAQAQANATDSDRAAETKGDAS